MENIDHVFESEQLVLKPIESVFAFFAEAKNLEVITPPWLKFQLVKQSGEAMQSGLEIEYQIKVHSIPMRWISRIDNFRPNDMFTDEQIKGPYARWYHTHSFVSVPEGTLVKDHVSYRLPLGRLGNLIAGSFVKRDIKNIFAFRRVKITEIFR